MKIADIRTIPLVGATPDGGWEQGYDPGDNLHTLLEIITDEGVTGLGSVFTSTRLVSGSLALLRPMLIGESIEPARVAEKLHQATFWQGLVSFAGPSQRNRQVALGGGIAGVHGDGPTQSADAAGPIGSPRIRPVVLRRPQRLGMGVENGLQPCHGIGFRTRFP